MKTLKKIGAALLAVAMLCSMSVVAFADGDVNAVYGNTVAESQISINNAKVEKSTGILTVTLDYSIQGTVAAGDQITMLGYIFDGEQSDASQVEPIPGYIRAIYQAAAVADNGQIVFKLATAGEGYTVAENAKMVVKLGSNAASVTKAQAFFIDLAAVTESGILGDADGNEIVNGQDAMAIRQYAFNDTPLARLDLADVDGNQVVNGQDAMAIRQFVFNDTPFPGAQ